jgi:hypothetical protein
MSALTLLAFTTLIGCDQIGFTVVRTSTPPSANESPEAQVSAPKERASPGVMGGYFSDQDCDDRTGVDVDPVNDCLSGTLTCGQTIFGHTENGGSRFTGPFYTKKFCEALADPYPGEERVYKFSMTPQQVATIELTSNCGDLDLFILQWRGDECPEMNHMVHNCEADTTSRGGSIVLEAITNPRHFLIVIEGKRGIDAPFELTAECKSRN